MVRELCWNRILSLFLVICFLSTSWGCSGFYLRQPTSFERNYFLISKNLDRAIIDPAERGPLNILPLLMEADGYEDHSPMDMVKRQKGLVAGDLFRVGYDDNIDDLGGMPSLSGDEKGQTILIATLIVVGVIVGVTVPLLIALNVF